MPNGQSAEQIVRDLNSIQFGLIAFTILASWLLLVTLQRIVPWLAQRLPARFRFYLLPLVPIFRLLILGAAILRISLLIIQPSTQNLFAIVGASAVAIGFAFKDYVSSIIAGIVAIYEHPYRTGDWVTIDGDYGEVTSVGLRAISIRTPDDTEVTVPHARIWDSNITNANSGQRTHMCIAEFYLHPNHDAHRVRQLLWDVAQTSPYTQLDRPIQVIVSELPWATRYRLKAYPIDGRDEFQFTSDLTVRGKSALAHAGAEPALLPPAHIAQASPPFIQTP